MPLTIVSFSLATLAAALIHAQFPGFQTSIPAPGLPAERGLAWGRDVPLRRRGEHRVPHGLQRSIQPRAPSTGSFVVPTSTSSACGNAERTS